jgi:hypothetical protein
MEDILYNEKKEKRDKIRKVIPIVERAKCFMKLLSLIMHFFYACISVISTNESERPILDSLQTSHTWF